MTDTLPRFRVTLFIRGSVTRPCYGPSPVEVFAVNEEGAIGAAIRRVQDNGFKDVWIDAFRVDGVERIE